MRLVNPDSSLGFITGGIGYRRSGRTTGLHIPPVSADYIAHPVVKVCWKVTTLWIPLAR